MDTTRASLLLRIRDRRNADAWREFDAIYRPLLSKYARLRGLDEAECDDIVQHCMAAVHAHIDSFDYDPSRGRFKGWLRTLVNNRVRNLFRDRREQLAQSKDFRRVQEREETPDEAFEKIWLEEHLRHCLHSVCAEVEEATFIAYRRLVLEGWPVARVCDEMQMTQNQVYKIKWRVTQKLDEKMRAILGDDV